MEKELVRALISLFVWLWLIRKPFLQTAKYTPSTRCASLIRLVPTMSLVKVKKGLRAIFGSSLSFSFRLSWLVMASLFVLQLVNGSVPRVTNMVGRDI